MGELDRLTKLIDQAFRSSRWHVQELTDAEFFHKPTAECWSVWWRDEAPRPDVLGTGAWVVDNDGQDGRLVTTIGWRLLHLAMYTDIYREWTFGIRRPQATDYEFPGNAEDAVAWLHATQDAFAKEVHALSEEDVSSARPTYNGRHRSAGDLIWIIAVEHLHHGAEIGVLRDIIRGRARDGWDPW